MKTLSMSLSSKFSGALRVVCSCLPGSDVEIPRRGTIKEALSGREAARVRVSWDYSLAFAGDLIVSLIAKRYNTHDSST